MLNFYAVCLKASYLEVSVFLKPNLVFFKTVESALVNKAFCYNGFHLAGAISDQLLLYVQSRNFPFEI